MMIRIVMPWKIKGQVVEVAYEVTNNGHVWRRMPDHGDERPLVWTVPPACQGQVIEIAYASSRDGLLWRRWLDRSDGEMALAVADADSCGCDDECECWRPWDSEPTGYEWSTQLQIRQTL